jgi:ribonuclease D
VPDVGMKEVGSMAPMQIEIFVEAQDSELLRLLIEGRRKIAADESRFETQIVETRVLQAIAAMKPTTREQLASLPGMDVENADRYVGQFLNIVKTYFSEQISPGVMQTMSERPLRVEEIRTLPGDVQDFAKRLRAYQEKPN